MVFTNKRDSVEFRREINDKREKKKNQECVLCA